MIKNEGNGRTSKYCDWCGKYCSDTGIDTWGHNFCSERCKRAYDNANGTVDGGYRSGSFGHKLHKTAKKNVKIIETILLIAIGLVVLLGILLPLIKK